MFFLYLSVVTNTSHKPGPSIFTFFSLLYFFRQAIDLDIKSRRTPKAKEWKRCVMETKEFPLKKKLFFSMNDATSIALVAFIKVWGFVFYFDKTEFEKLGANEKEIRSSLEVKFYERFNLNWIDWSLEWWSYN